MQQAEQTLIDSGTSVDELMQRAGTGAAQHIWRTGADMQTLVLCGPGNNGGDGYVIAEWLRRKGVEVKVAAATEPTTDAAKEAQSLWKGETLALNVAKPAPQVIDCLFGTGLTRPLSEEILQQFARLSDGAKRKVAVDLPSGVHSDTGNCLNPVCQFNLTIALGAFKPAHYLEPARSIMGAIIGVDIGISAVSELSILAKPRINAPATSDHKYSRGLVAVVAGDMIGAANLAAMAAQKSGAGYVKIFGRNGFHSPKQSIVVEEFSGTNQLCELLKDDRIAIIVVGPGLGRGADARELLQTVLDSDKPLLLDADALVLLGDDFAEHIKARKQAVIATPHQGEFAKIAAKASGSKVEKVQRIARASGSTILLKGSDTIVSDDQGTACLPARTCSWLSTAGSGDVLSGIIASRFAVEKDPLLASKQGLWLHTRAGQLAGASFSPETLIGHIPDAVSECV